MTLIWSTDENQNEDQKISVEYIIDIEQFLMTIDFFQKILKIWTRSDQEKIYHWYDQYFKCLSIT